MLIAVEQLKLCFAHSSAWHTASLDDFECSRRNAQHTASLDHPARPNQQEKGREALLPGGCMLTESFRDSCSVPCAIKITFTGEAVDEKQTINRLFGSCTANVTLEGSSKVVVCQFQHAARGAGRDVYLTLQEGSELALCLKVTRARANGTENISECKIFQKFKALHGLCPKPFFQCVQTCGDYGPVDLILMEKAGRSFSMFHQLLIIDAQGAPTLLPSLMSSFCTKLFMVFQLWAKLPDVLNWQSDMHTGNVCETLSGTSWWWVDWAQADDPPCSQSKTTKFTAAWKGSNNNKHCFREMLASLLVCVVHVL